MQAATKPWAPGAPITSASDLEIAAGSWGWKAGNLKPRVIARCHRITQVAPIATAEIESAREVVAKKASNGDDRVAFFLGIVERERERADVERNARSPPVEGQSPEDMKRREKLAELKRDMDAAIERNEQRLREERMREGQG